MSQAPNNSNVVYVPPKANVYTILIVVAILALIGAITVVLMKLMGEPPVGYGLQMQDLWSPFSPANGG